MNGLTHELLQFKFVSQTIHIISISKFPPKKDCSVTVSY